MPRNVKIRAFSGAVSRALSIAVSVAVFALFVGALFVASAAAQTGEPIKIGYSMALTGGLAPNGKSALLAQKIWEEDTNANGGPTSYFQCDSTLGRARREIIHGACGAAPLEVRFFAGVISGFCTIEQIRLPASA